MKNCNDKLTKEEIKELMKYASDIYHRAIVEMTFGNYENVEDIQKVGRDAILNFASYTLEICNKRKSK